ncbi:MAG TPA: hypothetical protein VGL22_14420 [Terracidiphilus sp.]
MYPEGTGYRNLNWFQTGRNHRRLRGFAIATAVLCLILLALLSLVQVAHVHSTATDADHCQLCIVLHAAAPSVAAIALIVLVQFGSSLPALQTSTIIRPWHPTLFTRPPPAGC